MPIYEYHCLDCNKDHEIIRKISDKPVKVCPSCKGRLKKKMSLSGFQLVGGGWYKDGYSSSTTPKPSSTTSAATPATGTPAPSLKTSSPQSSSPATPAKKEKN